MAHLLLHQTCVRLLEGEDNLHPLAQEALKRRRALAFLGCTLPDLPNFHGLPAQLLGTLMGRDTDPNPWAARFHHDKPMAFGLELVRRRDGDRALGPLARLALGMGYFSHAALDTALHPLTHRLCNKESHNGDSPLRSHRRIEKYQAILMHPRLTGVQLAQDGFAWANLDLTDAADLERVLDVVNQASQASRGEAPATPEWHGWLAGLRQYAQWARRRLPQAEGGSMDLETARARYVTEPKYEDALLAAQTRAVAWCNRLALAFEGGDVKDGDLKLLGNTFKEVDLDTDSDLCADHALALEVAHQRDHIHVWLERARAHNRADHSAMAGRPPPPIPVGGQRDGELHADHDGIMDGEPDGAPFGGQLDAKPDGFQELHVGQDSAQGGPDGTDEDDPLRPKGRAPR
jgi:hypothetical protein